MPPPVSLPFLLSDYRRTSWWPGRAQSSQQKAEVPKDYLFCLSCSHVFHLEVVAWASAACEGHVQGVWRHSIQASPTSELRLREGPCREKGPRNPKDAETEHPPSASQLPHHTVPSSSIAVLTATYTPIFFFDSWPPHTFPETPTPVSKDRRPSWLLQQHQ